MLLSASRLEPDLNPRRLRFLPQMQEGLIPVFLLAALRSLAEATSLSMVYSKTLSCSVKPDWEDDWLGRECLCQ